MTPLADYLALGWLFIHPLSLPYGAGYGCAAAGRVRRAGLTAPRVPPWFGSCPARRRFTFINTVLGMVLIAVAFYVVHAAVGRFL